MVMTHQDYYRHYNVLFLIDHQEMPHETILITRILWNRWDAQNNLFISIDKS
jgi:hypothetical protein